MIQNEERLHLSESFARFFLLAIQMISSCHTDPAHKFIHVSEDLMEDGKLSLVTQSSFKHY